MKHHSITTDGVRVDGPVIYAEQAESCDERRTTIPLSSVTWWDELVSEARVVLHLTNGDTISLGFAESEDTATDMENFAMSLWGAFTKPGD